MGGCCGKRDGASGQGNTTALGGITSNEIPKLLEFTNNFFGYCNLRASFNIFII